MNIKQTINKCCYLESGYTSITQYVIKNILGSDSDSEQCCLLGYDAV